jgi:hypothetical protein
MLFGSGHLISSAGIATGVLVLTAFAAWAAIALLTVLALRRTGESGMKGALWGGGLVLGGVVLTFLLLERMPTRDLGFERRAVEARASELTARAIAPGSALTCLDAVASIPVETACEKALFATPETVAAAVAYVEARYALLVASAVLAVRDPSYQPAVERLRRGIEEDRFGVAAQVFSTRGCNAPDCADFAVLRDSRRIVANMKGNTFASHVEAHAVAWNPSGAASVLVAPLMSSATVRPPPGMAHSPPVSTEGAAAAPATASTSVGSGRRYDYPSANSIPAISIMDPESAPPPAAEPKTAPQKRPAPRRQAAPDRAPVALPPPPAPPPTAALPQTQSQTSGSR